MDGSRSIDPVETDPAGTDPVDTDPVDTDPVEALGPVELTPGASIGPFVVERELGRGSTAVVLAAHDPALDRRVAIKLLHQHPSGVSAERRARFLREARALAKLRHPNVITVYQVGTVGDQIFLAMEMVEGETFGAWLARSRPSAPEILDAYVLAGRGLAAAHRAELVHRDFKPDNVLRDKDGRVLVTDFGLVAAPSGASPEGKEPTPDTDALTQTGDVLGTPRYMSPEQHAGQPTDARSDQFSFAVALYEALHGARPFAGTDRERLRENVLAGRLQSPPRPAGVPRRVVAALRRALAVDPAARFPSMDALVARLERRPLVTVGRLALAAGLAAAVLATVAVARDRSRLCSGAGRQIAGAWDGARRDAVHASFLATGRPHAESTFLRVSAALDDYARGWADMRAEACEATAVRHEQSEAVRGLRMACLDQRLRAFSALTRVLADSPSPDLVDGSLRATQGLEGLAACADTAALTAGVAPPSPELAGRVAGLHSKLDEANALATAGRSKDAYERLRTLPEEARAIGYKPLLAQVLARLGEVEAETADGKTAHATLEEAVSVAADVKDDATVARSLGLLMQVIGVREARPAEALALRAAADAAVRRAGNDDLLRAQLHHRVGNVLLAQGTFGEAAKELEQALALREAALGRSHLEIVRTLVALARVLVKDAKFDDARAKLLRALEVSEKLVGPDHPDAAGIHTELGSVAFNANKLPEALAEYERAHDIVSRSVGEETDQAGGTLNNIAMILDEQQRYDEALAMYRRALALREKTLGPEHTAVAGTLTNIGVTLRNKGDLAGARAAFEKSLAIREKTLGPEHADLATPLLNLGNMVADMGDLDAAAVHLARCLAIRRKTLRPDHPNIARALTELALISIDRDRSTEAIPLLEEALTIVADKPEHATQAAKSRYRLAQALWKSGADRPRAEKLGAEARAFFVANGIQKWVDEVDKWKKVRRR